MKFARLLWLGLVICASPAWAQKSKIEIKNADEATFATRKGEKVNVLKGNVVYEHQGAIMRCDSSWLSSNGNQLIAFSRVSVNQGDSLRMFADQMDYNGKTKILNAIGNVRLNDTKMRLTTDRIRFDRNTRQATYSTGGVIQTQEDHLTSRTGIYFADAKTFRFSHDVVLTNPRYTMVSDTMFFDTQASVARFYGPTTISGKDSRI